MYGEYISEVSVPLPQYKTNNQAELSACCLALNRLKQPCNVTLHTDSSYVEKGITQWVKGWKRKGWKTSKGEPVKNKELWLELDELIKVHNVDFRWVKAHADNEYNNLADALAVKASNEVKDGRI